MKVKYYLYFNGTTEKAFITDHEIMVYHDKLMLQRWSRNRTLLEKELAQTTVKHISNMAKCFTTHNIKGQSYNINDEPIYPELAKLQITRYGKSNYRL